MRGVATEGAAKQPLSGYGRKAVRERWRYSLGPRRPMQSRWP